MAKLLETYVYLVVGSVCLLGVVVILDSLMRWTREQLKRRKGGEE